MTREGMFEKDSAFDGIDRVEVRVVAEPPDVTNKVFVTRRETKDDEGKIKVIYEEWFFQKHKIRETVFDIDEYNAVKESIGGD